METCLPDRSWVPPALLYSADKGSRAGKVTAFQVAAPLP